jgi:methionine-rich copper-binding protein CopC
MTRFKLLSAALIAAAMLAGPAMARSSHVTSRYPAENVHGDTSPAIGHTDGHLEFSAPHVDTYSAVAPDGENCDVGDNPEIC